MDRIGKSAAAARFFRRGLLSGIMVAMASASALAGGFYAPYQSGAAMGTGLAGASARNDDASFFFYNPATISGLPTATLTVEAPLFVPSFSFETEAAVSPLGANLTAAGDSGELTDPAIGPAAFASIPLIENRLWLGLGASGPFAVDIKAEPGWAGRFHFLKTEMIGQNLSAALAFKPVAWLTLAAGVQAQHFNGEFEKSELIPLGFGAFGEARGFLEGHSWAFGAVAGALIEPTPSTRIGIGYRSRLTHRLEGTAGATLPGVPVPTESAEFDVKLPDIVSIGIEQRIGDAWRVFGEAQWHGWSRFDGFDIAFGSGRPNEVRPQTWQDTWLVAAGAGWAFRPGSEVTAGIHYDTGASEGGTNTLSPDADRTTVALGFNQRLGDHGSLSFHYAHIFFQDAPIDVAQATSGTFRGTFGGHVDTLGASLKLNW